LTLPLVLAHSSPSCGRSYHPCCWTKSTFSLVNHEDDDFFPPLLRYLVSTGKRVDVTPLFFADESDCAFLAPLLFLKRKDAITLFPNRRREGTHLLYLQNAHRSSFGSPPPPRASRPAPCQVFFLSLFSKNILNPSNVSLPRNLGLRPSRSAL